MRRAGWWVLKKSGDDRKRFRGSAVGAFVSMGVYVFNRKALIDVLNKDAALESSAMILLEILYRSCTLITGCLFTGLAWSAARTRPHWRDIGTIDAYYQANMDLCFCEPHIQSMIKAGQSEHMKVIPPQAVFADEDKGGRKALDSIICSGVIISGGRVERSILSPGVVNSYAQIG